MKNLTCFIILFCISLSYGKRRDFQRIDSIKIEEECTDAGGRCTVREDCPKGKLTEENRLCPRQRGQGIECCLGISVKETRCKKRGGDCIPEEDPCEEHLVYEDAYECRPNTKCCLKEPIS